MTTTSASGDPNIITGEPHIWRHDRHATPSDHLHRRFCDHCRNDCYGYIMQLLSFYSYSGHINRTCYVVIQHTVQIGPGQSLIFHGTSHETGKNKLFCVQFDRCVIPAC